MNNTELLRRIETAEQEGGLTQSHENLLHDLHKYFASETKITLENNIQLYDRDVTVSTIEMILTALRKHGCAYIEVADKNVDGVPTLAEVLFR